MLEFNIKNQTISRVDRFDPATDSVDYLTAKFNFITADWDGKTKKALFRSGTVSYEAAINASGVCTVPWEVLVSPENKFSALSGGCIKIFVSVVGTSGTIQIPTKECRVELGASGLTESLNGAEPTPNLYEQFVDTIKADNDATVAEIKADNDETRAEVEALTERAETAQTSAEQSAARMKNDYANSIKGKVSGEVVRVDDVSPVEHTAKIKVKGKNMVDISTMLNTNFVDNGNGTYTLNKTTSSRRFSGDASILIPAHNPFIMSIDVVNDTTETGLRLSVRRSDGSVSYWGLENSGQVRFFDNDVVSVQFYINSTENDNASVTIKNFQIELGDTVTEYTPYIDPATVTLTRCGKNLIPLPYKDGGIGDQYTNAGITYTVNPDGSITANGTATTNSYFRLCNVGFGEAYIYENSAIGGFACSDCQYDDGNEFTFIMIGKGATVTNKVYYPQVEVGTVVTEYEKPREQVTYTPEADGSCDIVSLSPTMTLFTDTEGVTVDLEYNRDINAVIADILNKVGA